MSARRVPYVELIGPFALAGLGKSVFFAPAANLVLSDRTCGTGGVSGDTSRRTRRFVRGPWKG